MTNLEALAVELHDHLWFNIGNSADWPLHMGGDDDAVDKLIYLLNELQREVKANGYNHIA
jgi:hypothetical protein